MDLNSLITNYEAQIRLGFFFGVFFVMALWEVVFPRRQLLRSKLVRWVNNLALVLLNTLLLRLLFPAAAVGIAIIAEQEKWGVFNLLDLPFAIAVLVSIVVMDMVIYLQHLMFHAVPILWRLHRVHHADPDFDVTTGARFHPIEIILSMGIKFCVIVLLGPPIMAVILFEILLSSAAMFNHSNARINTTVDKYLRYIIVTPDMHRVHHSVSADETNSNFGFNLPWWDRLFGTYREQPRHGHQAMTIGINDFNKPEQVTRLHKILLLPFIGKVGNYAINNRFKSNNVDNN